MSQRSPNQVGSPRTQRLRVRVLAVPGLIALSSLAAFLTVVEFPSTDPELSLKELMATAQEASRAGRDEEALRLLEQIPDDGSSVAVRARHLAGDLLLSRFKRLTAAEEQFRRAVAQEEDSLHGNDRLAYLMHLGTRGWELAPFELSVIQQGKPTLGRMKTLAMSPNLNTNAAFINECAQIDPQDPAVLLGQAAVAIFAREYARAEEFLRRAAQIDPHPPIVEFRLGEVMLLRNASDAEFRVWHRNLPAHALDFPGVWLILGLSAERQNQFDVAVRCFWEALRHDPNLGQANYRLGQLLIGLNRPETAEPFLDRSRRLTDYINVIEMLSASNMKKSRRIAIGLEAAELTENLGLLFEACGWFGLILQSDPADSRARQGFARLHPRLSTLERVRTLPAENPALKTDLSDYSLPDVNGTTTVSEVSSPLTPVTGRVTFEDRAAAVGLNYEYITDQHEPGIYALNGGGVAILDYDGDCLPDIYLTQGGAWPPPDNRAQPIDRLYRNLGNGHFQDVTSAAGLVEDRYSHGATVGDYNSDGHPDLYVANLDANRLYQNNGDGTFTDVTSATGTGGNRWTSSCAMADFNADSWPDIYVVNYLGETGRTTICRNAAGRLHDCNPRQFPAEQDRLYLNRGDGRFEDVTADAGIVVADGKGLGIVAADFDRSGKLEIYIANDGVPNFLFVNQAAAGHCPRFVELALPQGVAVNGRGDAEAGMGVATGDMDGNGLLDVFVTNFSDESNTLYLNQPGHTFTDATHFAGLREPSLPMLAFGTQCIDGELDGRPDLIVTNGHIDPDPGPHLAYQMEPQYFLNRGDARFMSLPAESLGRFFDEKRLGRGMARIDWNRDGLEDVVISHIDSPVTLLTNTTVSHGHYISISCRGVGCDRDAIGTVVTLTAGGSTLSRQLTAGDGYQASNERVLVFGLGEAMQAVNLQIDWPSGRKQNLEELPADACYLIIEGREQSVLLSSGGNSS